MSNAHGLEHEQCARANQIKLKLRSRSEFTNCKIPDENRDKQKEALN
jgi:hypothetical protein